MQNTGRIRRITLSTGLALAALVALLLPLGYFGVSYRYSAGALETEAEINAETVSGIINSNPDMWRFEQLRLQELLERRLRSRQAEWGRILDKEQRVVAEGGTPIAYPALIRSCQLMDAGEVAGSIQVGYSLRPLLLRTCLIALLGIALGGAVFLLLWTIPFRGIILAERRRQEFIDKVMQSGTTAVMMVDLSGAITMANARSAAISGLSVAELVGMQFTLLFNRDDIPYIDRHLTEVAAGWSAMTKFETVMSRGDGKELHLSCGAVPLFLEDTIVNLLISVDDVTERVEAQRDLLLYTEELTRQIAERKRAEEGLASEKELLSVTLRSIADGVISADPDGCVTLMNWAAEQFTGWPREEALGTRLEQVFRVKDSKCGAFLENLVGAATSSKRVLEMARNIVLVTREGQELAIDLKASAIRDSSGNVIGAVFVIRDITGRLALEGEYLKRQKLESIGVLAGGIAHDFNNLLTAILGNVSLARRYAGENKRCVDRLKAAEKASFRARDLTKQFLTFTKGGKPVRKLSRLSDVIQYSVDFGLIASNVVCEFHLQSDLWTVEIDESQVSEVIHNLVINACQAMPEGGLLRVSGRNVTLEEGQPLPLKPGNYVMISVSDQGSGIPPELLPRIFDPYCTTKEGGSGLGLAVAFSVMQKHDGHISVESIPNEGTTFHLYLPASEQEVVEESADEEPLRKGKGRVLLMDDEEMVLEAGSEMLTLLGYQVELAADGEEMLEKYHLAMESGNRIDAVVIDLTIPGAMGGEEAVKRLLELDPQARAIVSSGFSDNAVMADYQAYGFCAMVPKPYTIAALERAVRTAVEW